MVPKTTFFFVTKKNTVFLIKKLPRWSLDSQTWPALAAAAPGPAAAICPPGPAWRNGPGFFGPEVRVRVEPTNKLNEQQTSKQTNKQSEWLC